MVFNKSNCTVLICDDDPVTNRMLSAKVKKFGYEVVGVAENGLEALNLVNEKRPAIVLLDINMPMGSGLTVLRFIRESKMQSKVIMLTSDDSPDSVLTAKKLGVDDYIIKPSLDTNRLFEALRRISEPDVPGSSESDENAASEGSEELSPAKKIQRMARAEREDRSKRR